MSGICSSAAATIRPAMSSVASSSNGTTWQLLWEDAQTRLTAIRESMSLQTPPAPRIARVGKLDAELLDQEIVTLLQEPIAKALSLINVSTMICRK